MYEFPSTLTYIPKIARLHFAGEGLTRTYICTDDYQVQLQLSIGIFDSALGAQ